MVFLERFIDYCWVLQAFFRGKVLCQRSYRPLGNFFQRMPGGKNRRMEILIRWWGCRKPTWKELKIHVASVSFFNASKGVINRCLN